MKILGNPSILILRKLLLKKLSCTPGSPSLSLPSSKKLFGMTRICYSTKVRKRWPAWNLLHQVYWFSCALKSFLVFTLFEECFILIFCRNHYQKEIDRSIRNHFCQWNKYTSKIIVHKNFAKSITSLLNKINEY